MKTKNNPLKTTTPTESGVDVAPRLRHSQYTEPPTRSGGKKVAEMEWVADLFTAVPGLLERLA